MNLLNSERESKENNLRYTNVTRKRNVSEAVVIHMRSYYFFCSAEREGSEYIKGVKNFVSLLAPYRGFLVFQQVVSSKYILWLR